MKSPTPKPVPGPMMLPWWLIILAAVLMVLAGYLAYRGVAWLRTHWASLTRWQVAREYRYIRANQARLARDEEFYRVKAAWLNLMAHYGFARQPAETLVQQALRLPAAWAPVREAVLVFARACDAETYGGAALSAASRADAIRLYLALYERLPELARPTAR